jgi:hypothetical protein
MWVKFFHPTMLVPLQQQWINVNQQRSYLNFNPSSTAAAMAVEQKFILVLNMISHLVITKDGPERLLKFELYGNEALQVPPLLLLPT